MIYKSDDNKTSKKFHKKRHFIYIVYVTDKQIESGI